MLLVGYFCCLLLNHFHGATSLLQIVIADWTVSLCLIAAGCTFPRRRTFRPRPRKALTWDDDLDQAHFFVRCALVVVLVGVGAVLL